VITQVPSSELAPSVPAMWGRATLAIEESSTSMNVASVTVTAMIHGLINGRPGTEPALVMSFAWAMS
jgi:hypothetical protein